MDKRQVQGQVKRCGRCCAGFALPLAAFAGQELDGFGKGFSVKLHDKINGIAALALAVATPFVSPDGQAVMFFPAVFPSAFDKRLSLCCLLYTSGLAFGLGGVCPGKKFVSGNVISPYPLKAFIVSQRKGKGLSGRRKGCLLYTSRCV